MWRESSIAKPGQAEEVGLSCGRSSWLNWSIGLITGDASGWGRVALSGAGV